MKEKILSIISLVTIFVPLTMLFVWKPTAANATAIAHYSYFSKNSNAIFM